jgi:hypothetical protein
MKYHTTPKFRVSSWFGPDRLSLKNGGGHYSMDARMRMVGPILIDVWDCRLSSKLSACAHHSVGCKNEIRHAPFSYVSLKPVPLRHAVRFFISINKRAKTQIGFEKNFFRRAYHRAMEACSSTKWFHSPANHPLNSETRQPRGDIMIF